MENSSNSRRVDEGPERFDGFDLRALANVKMQEMKLEEERRFKSFEELLIPDDAFYARALGILIV